MRLPILLSATAVVLAAASPHAKRAAIDDCLKEAKVPVTARNSTQWKTDAGPFNDRLAYDPVAVAIPTTVEHIQAAVSCAAELGVKLNPKSGGHSYASFGLGGEDGHLVVELDRMYNVTLDPETHIATVQPGARLGHIATVIYEEGKRAFSHGTCPGVGVGGHSLHGGFGFSSHTHGLAVDWITSADVVLANGSLVTASETENPDLFWALRGAGSNFGIVASFRFKTFAVPQNVTSYEINLPWSNSTNMVKGWGALQGWLLNGSMPEEMNMRILGNGFQTQLQGLYHGNSSALKTAIEPLLKLLGAKLSNVKDYDWMEGFEHYAYTNDIDVTDPDYNQSETFYSKSLVTSALPADVLKSVAEYWIKTAKKVTRSWYIIIDLYGGPNSAITRVAPEATSYAFRDPKKHLFLYQLYDRSFGAYPDDGFEFLDGWVDAFTGGLDAEQWGMYINYADPRLDRAEAQDVYYRQNLARLRQIKKQVDPAEVFYYPQAVEPAEA
ncbi:FAD linked oxidase [Corynascus novoguineensis]|uniref:FAD linked oxidase n=1 Tax=Corynascus novoguineensis TaxID=1126955 RepID=A0AAN7HKU2_9PEZI|nr:FAD linked oxidase [Corynascus novoguineensis]